MPSKVAGICDQCGGELVQRADDKEDVVRSRLVAYHAQTQPLVDYYAERGVLFRVDGNAPVDRVFNEIRKVLEF
jgi:adenylate kinase